MVRRKSVFGVSTCLVAWLAMVSMVWGQTPGFVTVHLEVGGQPAGAIRVLTWEGDRPDVIEVSEPSGRWNRIVMDSVAFEALTWREDAVSGDDSVHGRMRVPTALGSLAYEVHSRPLRDGSVEVLLNPEGQPNDQVRAVVQAPEPSLDDGVVSPHNGWIWVVVYMVVATCMDKQEAAMAQCIGAAMTGCGAGNVGHYSYAGVCGQGSCDWSCK
jgi:hypothetical protein